jgi:outer membrane protein assembly factor BamB
MSVGPLRRRVASAVLLVCIVTGAQGADHPNWSCFRGPEGKGAGPAVGVPIPFSEADYRWQCELPGSGHASPVLWGNRVFTTFVDEEGGQRGVVCLDSGSGKQLWVWRASYERYHNHRDNSFAACTPALDGERLYITWVSGGRALALALDHDGKPVWNCDLGAFKATHGAGSSAAIVNGMVVVVNDQQTGDAAAFGLDPVTGDIRWRTPRRNGKGAYATPATYREPGGAMRVLLSSTANGLSCLDPGTGEVVWQAPETYRNRVVATPVVADGVIYVSAGQGGIGREAAAVTPGPDGPRVKPLPKKDLPYVPTPLAAGPWLFMLGDRGVLRCLRARTAEVMWREELLGHTYASPVLAGDRIICVDRKGNVVAVRAAPEFELLGRCALPEGTHATPAVTTGGVIFRTYTRMICVGAKSE